MIDRIQFFFQTHAFGVCTRLGEKLGIATSSIRLFFIYASFLTFGSPVIIYLALAFVMNIRKYLRRRKSVEGSASRPVPCAGVLRGPRLNAIAIVTSNHRLLASNPLDLFIHWPTIPAGRPCDEGQVTVTGPVRVWMGRDR